jgi:glycosyltransferase involved in cell wall biosynthesis
MISRDQLVSVVIPTHNRATLVARAIRSVQCQTHPNLEIIVVDDGSTDNTMDVVESLGDQRIRYVRHDINRGASAARNTGIHLATGEFIGFLDSDVEWEPETITHQLSLLGRYDAVLCTAPGAVGNRYRRKEKIPIEDLRRGRFVAAGTSALMARTAPLRGTLFDETLWFAEDWDVVIRLAQEYSVGYLNEPLVREIKGRHPRVSNTRNMSVRELENACQMLRKHKQFLGPKWFKLHMCRILLAGIAGSRTPKEKMTDILYTARRYGAVNVVWTLSKRFLLRQRDRLQRIKSRFEHWRHSVRARTH